MSAEHEQLIEAVKQLTPAIEALKNEHSILESYIWPVGLSFFAALFGAISGYTVIRAQEGFKITDQNILAADRWTLQADACFTNLVTIKRNYVDGLTDNPIQRSSIPIIPIPYPEVDIDITNLAFVSRKQKKTPLNKEDSEFKKIPRIGVMFRNYNSLLGLWQRRNSLAEPFIKNMVSTHPSAGAKAIVSFEEMESTVDPVELGLLIQETERVLNRTNESLEELLNFQTQFPKILLETIHKPRFLGAMRKLRLVAPDYPSVLSLEYGETTTKIALEKVSVNEELLKRYTNLPG